MSQQKQLLIDAFDRHWARLFGTGSLKVYGMTPADGETEIGEFTSGVKAHRQVDTTTGVAEADSGAWQFQVIASDYWATSEVFMLGAVALTVGSQRWKINKVQKPIGVIPVWKIRAEMQ
jgi:hypothetical protein